MSAPVPVVGVGADGLDGLAPRSRRVLEAATAIHGSPRQLELVAGLGVPLHPWPSPLVPALPALFGEIARSDAAIVASGDPMFHGIGSTLARVVGPRLLDVYPAPSSASLAAARLGWPLAGLDVHSCVTADPHVVLATARPGGRALVLCRDASTPAALARVLVDAGLGESALTVLADLGARAESRHALTATELTGAIEITGASARWSDLCVAAVEYRAAPGAAVVPGGPAPGLPDVAFVNDGQLTKRVARAVTVAALDPHPGALLWDIGGGSGSIGIEWSRMAPGARAVAVERDPGRAGRIRANALRLGVPGLDVVEGAAPASLDALPRPDAVFVGGGVTAPGLLDACWDALRPGGRLVAAAVTLESERVLADRHATHGGTLTRLGVETAEPLGSFTGWRPARPVVHLECVKPAEPPEEGSTP